MMCMNYHLYHLLVKNFNLKLKMCLSSCIGPWMHQTQMQTQMFTNPPSTQTIHYAMARDTCHPQFLPTRQPFQTSMRYYILTARTGWVTYHLMVMSSSESVSTSCACSCGHMSIRKTPALRPKQLMTSHELMKRAYTLLSPFVNGHIHLLRTVNCQ